MPLLSIGVNSLIDHSTDGVPLANLIHITLQNFFLFQAGQSGVVYMYI